MGYRRQLQYREIGEDEEDEEGEDERHLDIEQAKGKLRTWIKMTNSITLSRTQLRIQFVDSVCELNSSKNDAKYI